MKLNGRILVALAIFESLSGSMRPESAELVKLRAAVRQVFREKADLKEQLEIEINKHKQDAKRYGEEQRVLESEIARLEQTPESDLPSPEAAAKINEMMRKVDDLTTAFRQAKLDANECLRANTILEKEVEQHKATLSTLEDDLSTALDDRHARVQQRSKIDSLEESLRAKSREEGELELELRLKRLQLSKLKSELDEAVDRRPVLLLCRHPQITVGAPSNIVSAAISSYHTMTKNTQAPTDKEIAEFLTHAPRRVKFLLEERRRLLAAVTTAEENLAKVDTPGSSASPEAVEKLRALVQQLARDNDKRKARIAKLKALADEQHATLKRFTGDASHGDVCLAASLREIIRQIGECPPNERDRLSEVAEHILDAMMGV